MPKISRLWHAGACLLLPHLALASTPATPPDSPWLRAHLPTLDSPAATPPAEAQVETPAASLRPRETHATSAGFWQAVVQQGGTPLVEPLPDDPDLRLVTFLWRDTEASRVTVVGSPTNSHDALQRWGESDIWYRSYRLPANTRFTYLIAPLPEAVGTDPQAQRSHLRRAAQADPLNPRRMPAPLVAPSPDAHPWLSTMALDAAPAQPWVEARPDTPPGSTTHARLASTVLGNERDIVIYRPAGYVDGPSTTQALLVMFDADAYATLVPPTLDNLQADGLIPPTAAVFIANPDNATRGRELPPNDDFQRFLGEELMPWLQAQGIQAPAVRTVVSGSSYGGLAAMYSGLRQPEWFGNILSLSGSFWWSPEGFSRDEGAPPVEPWMPSWAAELPRQPVRIYLDAGLSENGRGPIAGILQTSRQMRDVLTAKGYAPRYAEFTGGHDYAQWQGSVACGLLYLLADAGGAKGAEGAATSDTAELPPSPAASEPTALSQAAWATACTGR